VVVEVLEHRLQMGQQWPLGEEEVEKSQGVVEVEGGLNSLAAVGH